MNSMISGCYVGSLLILGYLIDKEVYITIVNGITKLSFFGNAGGKMVCWSDGDSHQEEPSWPSSFQNTKTSISVRIFKIVQSHISTLNKQKWIYLFFFFLNVRVTNNSSTSRATTEFSACLWSFMRLSGMKRKRDRGKDEWEFKRGSKVHRLYCGSL